jgi:hypothetical protein
MSKPAHSKGRIRQKVREVLNIRPGFGKTERMIHEGVNELLGGGVSLEELREAVEYNVSERMARSEYLTEAEETIWLITAEGQAKENIR